MFDNHKTHYKMYKNGKNWVFSLITVSIVSIGMTGGTYFLNDSIVHADTLINSNNDKSQQPVVALNASDQSSNDQVAPVNQDVQSTKPQNPDASDNSQNTIVKSTDNTETTIDKQSLSNNNQPNSNDNTDKATNETISTTAGSTNLIADQNEAAIQDGLNIKISDLNSDNPTYDNGGLMPIKVDTSITNPNVSIIKGDNIKIDIPDPNQIDWDNSYINGFSNPYGTAALDKVNHCVTFTFSSDVSQSEYGFSFYADIKFINVTTELQGPFTLTASFNQNSGESIPLSVNNPTFYTKHVPYDPSIPSVPFQEPSATYQGPNPDDMANLNNTIGGYAGGVAYKYDNGFMTASNRLDPVNATLQYKNRTYNIDTEGGSSIDIDSFIFYLPNSTTPLTYMQLYEQTGILLKSNDEHNLTLYIPDGYNDTNLVYSFNIMGSDPTATGDPFYKRYIYGSNFNADGYDSKADGFNGPNKATWALNLFYQDATSSPRLIAPNKSADLNKPPFNNMDSENDWLMNGVTAERMEDGQNISILDASDFNNAWNNKEVGTYKVKYQITDSKGQQVDLVIGFVTITESQSVTTTYVDEQTGQEIKDFPATVQSEMYGSSYTTSALDIPNYVLDSNRMPNNASGIVGSNPINVTYYYKHATKQVLENKNQTATINYVSQDGTALVPVYTKDFVFTRTGTEDLVTGETSNWSDWTTPAFNDPSTRVSKLEIGVKSPSITGYTLKNSDDAFVTGVLDGSHGFDYTVVYAPKEYQITVNYVTEDGTKVGDKIVNGNYHTSIDTLSDIPTDYHYISGPKEYLISDEINQTINVIVAKNQQSINGRDVTIYTGQMIPTSGTDYNATATDIDGKEIPVMVSVDDPYQQSGIATKSGDYQVTLTASNGLSKHVLLHVINSQAKVTAHDIKIYVGDNIPTNISDYGASALGMNGKQIGIISIDTSHVNNQAVGTYPVIITAADGQTKQVNVIVLANQAKVTAHDMTIHTGDSVPSDAKAYGASAVGKDGHTPVAIKSVDTSKVDNQVVGDYPVVITDTEGVTITVTVHVLANQAKITGHDVTIYAGDAMPEANAFGAAATNEDGKAVDVTVDTSKVNNEVAGTYPVIITAADGQMKQVNVIVLANQAKVTAHDMTIHTGDSVPSDAKAYGASAVGKDGHTPVVIKSVDTSKVDNQVVGDYPVVITDAEGVTTTVTVHVLANQAKIIGHDVTIYAGDAMPEANAFGAAATNEDGKAVDVTVDTSKVNNEVAGTYPVIITAADGQTKEVNVIVLANQAKVTAHDMTIHTGDSVPSDAKAYGASAVGKDGHTPVVIKSVDTSKVDNQVVGDYPVVITDAEGVTTTVTVHVLANQAKITGHDVTIYAGDAMPEASAFGAAATNEDGKAVDVTVDTSKVNNEVAGTYPVIITAADGQTKEVKVIVLAKHVPGENNEPTNPVTPAKSGTPVIPSESSDSSNENTTTVSETPFETATTSNTIAKPKGSNSTDSVANSGITSKNDVLPQTGQDVKTDFISIIGSILVSILGLFGLGEFRKKNRDKQ